MTRKTLNKEVISTLKFVYRMGLLKSLFICFVFLFSEAEYKIRWKGHSVHLRKNTSDFKVFRQVLVFGYYDFMPASRQVKTVVDLGANIGLTTLYYKTKYPNAQIISVEPEGENFAMLKKNVEGLSDVSCVKKAIWNKHKDLQINSSNKGEYAFFVSEKLNGPVNSVEAITLNELIDTYKIDKIDVLKIDVEGAEKELFTDNYKGWLPKVGSIVIELHDWFRPGCSATFFKAISSEDFSMESHGENVSILFDDPADRKHDVAIAKSAAKYANNI